MKDVNLLTSNGVDVQKGLGIFGDMQTYDESLLDFLHEIDEKLSSIENYKNINDMPNYAILVHSLKSDARYFGFDKLAELAYNHEMKSKENDRLYVNENYNELIIEAKRIVQLVKQYLQIAPSTNSAEVIESIASEDTRETILIADDSEIVRNFVVKIFSDKYDVLTAKDGNEAIQIIETTPSNKITACLLDLYMPNADGFSVLKYFKERDLFKSIPVSIITGNDSKEIDLSVFEYPVVDILKKPFNETSVKTIVERTISLHNHQN